MGHPLDGCRAKLSRAVDHLNAFNAEAVKYLQSHPYLIAAEIQEGRFVFKVERITPPEPKLGVILGDLLHNLRSALNHLICRLIEERGGTPRRANAFPIFLSRSDFVARVVHNPRGPLLGLDPGGEEWAHIERLQPYHRRNPSRIRVHALATLNALRNEDEHRVVLETLSAVQEPGPNTNLRFPHNSDVGWTGEILIHWGKALEPGTRIATVEFGRVGRHPHMEMHGELPVEIGLGEGRFKATGLPGLCGEIWRVIASFKRFFPDEGWPFQPTDEPIPPPVSLARK